MSHPNSDPVDEPGASPSTAPRAPQRVRLRYARTALLPAILAAFCIVPFASALSWWGLLLFIPIGLVIYLLYRVGADITPDAVHIRGPFYSRVIPRSEVAGFAVPDERRVHLVRTDSSTIVLPTARPRDLPRLRQMLFDLPGPDTESE